MFLLFFILKEKSYFMFIFLGEKLINIFEEYFKHSVIKKSKFVEGGLLKPSFKLTFGYEMFLRLTQNGVKIMSIPKIGYKHINLREGSIFWNYKNGEQPLTNDEVRFWVESAKKEYFFINDRNIKYEVLEA